MTNYKAFGLIFKSPFKIPEFILSSNIKYDVDIEIGNIPTSFKLLEKNKTKYFEKNKSQFLLKIDKVGHFFIREGKHIIIEPANALVHLDDIRLFLIGTCIGVILQQRKILALHASGLIINNKVTLFLGDSGVGKSTTVSQFVKKGYKVSGDDIQPIVWRNNLPFIIPSIPNIKLWEDAIKPFLNRQPQRLSKIRPEINKYRISVLEQFNQELLPIKKCIVLGWNQGSIIKKNSIPIGEAAWLLRNNTYRKAIYQFPEEKIWLFKQVLNLVNNVPIIKVSRNKKVHNINVFHDFLDGFLKKK